VVLPRSPLKSRMFTTYCCFSGRRLCWFEAWYLEGCWNWKKLLYVVSSGYVHGNPSSQLLEQQWILLTNGVIWWLLRISCRVGEWLLRKQFKNEIKNLCVTQVSLFLLAFHCKERISSKKAKKLSVTACAAHPVLRGRNKEFYSCLFF